VSQDHDDSKRKKPPVVDSSDEPRLPPSDEEAERIVLGAILLDPSVFPLVQALLPPDDLHNEFHLRVFRIFRKLVAEEVPISMADVKIELERDGELSIDDLEDLLHLTDGIPHVLKLEHYINRIRQAAKRRRSIQLFYESWKGAHAQENQIDDFLREAHARISGLITSDRRQSQNVFEQISDDRFRLELPHVGITFEIDRLRRERHELIGELCVKCGLAGARTYDGTLSVADFNLSSIRARTEWARILADLSRIPLDWPQFIEEFCQRILIAERTGTPAVDLRDFLKPGPDDIIRIDGLAFPRRHSTIMFGNGGAAKSYLALYLAGRLNQKGFNVALFDWELAGEDHRDRLERIFPEETPKILYVRCKKPLVQEVDHLKRIVVDHEINFAFYDSVAYACDGPPESAEVAERYARAVQQIGVSSIHNAHVTKLEDEKIFGSIFWTNTARATYCIKKAETLWELPGRDDDTLEIALFPKKANLWKIGPPIGYKITFTEDRTIFQRSNPADNEDLIAGLSIRDQIIAALRKGPLSYEELSITLDKKVNSIRKAVLRHLSGDKAIFTIIDDGKVALLRKLH
jgi:DnaB-like helicase N terminal domain